MDPRNERLDTNETVGYMTAIVLPLNLFLEQVAVNQDSQASEKP
jgi:hypothetical protein